MASIKIKKQKKTDEDSQADEDAKSESQSQQSDNPKRLARPKRLTAEGSKESSEVFQPQQAISLKKPQPAKPSSKPPQPDTVAHGQDYEAEREYLRYFEKEMYPLLQRIKQDLLVEKPAQIVLSAEQVPFCIDWIEKEKRGEHRNKPSRHHDFEEDQDQPKKSSSDVTKTTGKSGARDKAKK